MADVFLSYRREDWPFTRGVYERLTSAFGKANVFRDTDSLHYGEDWPEVIEHQLALCRVVLVVVSDQFLRGNTEPGTNDPLDFFHTEVRLALKRTPPIRVIPLIVEGTHLPGQEQLPQSLRGLFKRHGEVITEHRFDDDLDELIRELARYAVGTVKRTVSFITAGCVLAAGVMALTFRHDGLGYLFSLCPALFAGLIIAPLVGRMRWRLRASISGDPLIGGTA